MSWLKPYLRTWYRMYPESVPPTRQIAHYVKPLLKAHPEERIASELLAYLQKTPAQYINLAKFAATFGTWTPPPPSVRAQTGSGCVQHPERPWVATWDNKKLCRECFQEATK